MASGSGTWENGTSGSGTWNYNDSTKTLTISGTGALPNYTASSTSRPWSSYTYSAEHLIINSGITAIGNNVFRKGSTYLISVTIPDTVKSIGTYAFQKLNKLTTLNLGNGVQTIGANAFESCGFTNLTLPNSLTTIGNYAFQGSCSKVSELVIPDSVITIGDYAFASHAFTSLTLGKNVSTIGYYVFSTQMGSKIASLTIPSCVTTIHDRAFYGCNYVTELIFEGAAPPPTMDNYSLYIRTVSTAGDITVYTNGGWGSDDVFTEAIRGGSSYAKYNVFIYKRLGVPVRVNVGGTWKESTPYVNVNGTWKEVVGVYVNVNGTWKEAI